MRTIILIFIVLSFSNFTIAQISFFHVFSNNGADFGQGIVQLPDSSYVLTGSSSSFFEGPAQAFLMQIDSLGNYMWSKDYGGNEIESGRRVLYKENFGFFICGFTNSIGGGGFDFYLAKVDEAANLEWERAYGDYGWEKVHDAALTSDTGTIMVGETSSNVTDNKDIFIVRTDINGDTLWTKTIGGSGDDFATCIHPYDDTTYVIAGQTYVEDSMLVKGYITFIHEDGTVYWEDVIGDNGNYWVNDFSFSGGMILGVGGTESVLTDGIDVYSFFEDMGGAYWGGGNGGIAIPGAHENMAITTYGAGTDFYIARSSIDEWSIEGSEDLRIDKYTTPGLSFANSFTVGHPFEDVSGQLIKTSDGGAVLVGYSTGLVSGGNEVMVLKIGPNDLYPDPLVDVVVDNVVIVHEQDADFNVLVYPNPGSTLVNIKTDDVKFTRIKIINTMGQVILEKSFSFDSTIDVLNIDEGYYLIELSGSSSVFIRKKLLVKH